MSLQEFFIETIMIPVTMIMAMSLDGVIAKDSHHFANWTSPEDKKLFVEVSNQHGLIIMGRNTFNTFKAPLKDRLNVVFSRQTKLEPIDGVKWVSGDPKEVLKDLKEMGYTSALLGGGTKLNSLFLQHQLISEIIVTIEPKLFGKGLTLFDAELDLNLELLEMGQINKNSIKLRYRVVY